MFTGSRAIRRPLANVYRVARSTANPVCPASHRRATLHEGLQGRETAQGIPPTRLTRGVPGHTRGFPGKPSPGDHPSKGRVLSV
eukprot:7540519-Alexandrium_andersonii.AAC.1